MTPEQQHKRKGRSRDIYFFWSDSYMSVVEKFCKGVRLNIAYHIFTPQELRSLRGVEVIMCPQDSKEAQLANALQKECNKYGVVSLVKKPYEVKQHKAESE